MSNFKPFILQGFALVYIDDMLLLSNSKEQMFKLIEQLHIRSKYNLKIAPEKPIFILLQVKFFGYEFNTFKTLHSKLAAIHKIPSPLEMLL